VVSRQRQWLPRLLITVIMANLVVACSLLGGGESQSPYPAPDDGGNVALPGNGPTLSCSQECADRGQCGDSTDRGRVVLLSAAQPSVSALDHDLAITEGASVTVLEVRSVNVTENASGFEFPVNFYHVLIPDRNVEGWVAGWCVLNP
jgi:hypothetical protein